MTTKTNITNEKGKSGKAGTWKQGGFIAAKQPKKSITLLDILLGRK